MKNQLNWKLLGLVGMMMLWPLFGTAQVNLDSGLVAYYPFNGNANDESGNGNDGTVFGATLTTDRFNQQNEAYSFNQNYIQVRDSSILRSKALSISVWIAPSSTLSTQMVIGKINRQNASGEQYALVLDPPDGKIRFALKQNSSCNPNIGWQQVSTDSSVEIVEWTHIVGTFEDSIHKIYHNGTLVLETSLSQPGIDSCSGGDIQIGAWWQGGFQYFEGKIDEIRIYKRAITSEEVASLFNGTTSISSVDQAFFLLSPNPAPGVFTLRSPQAAIQSLTLYDLTGRRLPAEIAHDRHEAQVRSSYRGLALVKVQTNQGMWVQKVLFE